MLMLAQAGVLNMLSRGPFVAWKQVLIVMLAALMLVNWPGIKDRYYYLPLASLTKNCIFSIIAVFFLLAVVSFLRGGTPYNLAYTTFLYLGGIPFIVLPIVAMLQGRLRMIFRALMLMGILCGLGLVFDYWFSVYDMAASYLPVNYEFYQMIQDERKFGFVRAMFFFESTNTLAPFMTLCLVGSLVTLTFNPKSLLALFSIPIVTVGLLLVGQRSVFVLSFAFLFLAVIYIFIKARGTFLPAFLAGVTVLCVAGALIFVLRSESGLEAEVIRRYANPLDTTESANSHRFNRWLEGAKMVTSFHPVNSLIGHGLGLTVTALTHADGYHTHFESSFFQTFYEGGVLGVAIRFAPFILAFAVLLRRRLAARIDLLLASWLACCLLATLVAPNIGSFHIQASIWFMLGLVMVSPWVEYQMNQPMQNVQVDQASPMHTQTVK